MLGHSVFPHFQAKITPQIRWDLTTWLLCLDLHNGITPLEKQNWLSSDVLKLYTDASQTLGFAAVLGNQWVGSAWSESMSSVNIATLELYPIVLALYLWGFMLKNKCILFMCDNMSVVEVINKHTTRDSSLLTLIQHFVVLCMHFNINFRSKHIPGKLNVVADALSRLQFTRAKTLQPQLEIMSHSVPEELTLSRQLSYTSWDNPLLPPLGNHTSVS